MPKTKHEPAAVDEYLASLPEAERTTLEEVRQTIHAEVPGVSERISYGTTVIFAVRRDLVGFVAQPGHLSFFTMSPELIQAMRPEIRRTHKVSGATIHFSPSNPLPRSLMTALLSARLREQGE